MSEKEDLNGTFDVVPEDSQLPEDVRRDILEGDRLKLGDRTTTVDPDQWIDMVSRCKYLPEEDAVTLCNQLCRQLVMLPNVIQVSSPVTICGDIHGQFYDLLELFRTGGPLPSTKYIFMGDYVDRGYYSLETCTLLFCYLLRYPDRITLLRGNHESRRISSVYGFYDECQNKYGHGMVYRWFCKVFDLLPIAAIVDDKVMCVHGGLSPELKTIDSMMMLERAIEIPNSGPLCDIMWSDPEEDQDQDWVMSQRGAGWVFNGNAVSKFCENNALELVCRSHQLVDEGYRYYFDQKLATVWSAPNYCYRCGNVASVLTLGEDGSRDFRVFQAVSEENRMRPERNPAPYFL